MLPAFTAHLCWEQNCSLLSLLQPASIHTFFSILLRVVKQIQSCNSMVRWSPSTCFGTPSTYETWMELQDVIYKYFPVTFPGPGWEFHQKIEELDTWSHKRAGFLIWSSITVHQLQFTSVANKQLIFKVACKTLRDKRGYEKRTTNCLTLSFVRLSLRLHVSSTKFWTSGSGTGCDTSSFATQSHRDVTSSNGQTETEYVVAALKTAPAERPLALLPFLPPEESQAATHSLQISVIPSSALHSPESLHQIQAPSSVQISA